MTFKKVYELSEKFLSKTAEFDRNEKIKAEEERLSTFKEQIEDNFRSLLQEMEGDLLTLREKNYPREEWKEFVKIFQNLVKLRKEVFEHHPYEAARLIINTITDRAFNARLNTLEMSIQHFLKENQIQFDSIDELSQSAVHSLQKLRLFADGINRYVIEHPLVDDFKTTLPEEIRITPDIEWLKSNPEDKTQA